MEQNMLILTDGVFRGCMPKDIRIALSESIDAPVLAELFAGVSDKLGSLMHELDEDQWALYAFEEWYAIQQLILDRIREILIADKTISYPSRNELLSSVRTFMARNGYYNRSGWWVKANETGL